ncbi:MAG: DUF2752 domain-containing protein [Thermoguttaceae bacterium]
MTHVFTANRSDRKCGRTGLWKSLGIAAGILCALGVLFWQDPATSRAFPPCPFRAITGLRCPGCGTLRALHQLLHGNLVAALRLNPLMVISIVPLTLWLVASCLLPGYLAAAQERLGAGPVWAVLIVVVAFWILRNIPCYPFCLLGG